MNKRVTLKNYSLFCLYAVSIFGIFDSLSIVWFLSATDILWILLVAATTFDVCNKKKIPSRAVYIFIWGGAYVLSMLWGAEYVTATRTVRVGGQYFKGIGIIIMVIYWVSSIRAIKHICFAVGLVGLLSIFQAWLSLIFPDYSLFVDQGSLTTRFSILGIGYPEYTMGIFDSAGLYGMYAASGSLYISYFAISSNKNSFFKLATLTLGLLVGLFSVELSQSRSGLLSLFAGHLTFLLLVVAKGINKTLMPFVFNLVAISFLSVYLYISDFILSIGTGGIDLRSTQYLDALSTLTSAPLLGTGTNMVYGIGNVVHNSFLGILKTGGLLSVIISLFFAYYSVCYAYTRYKTSKHWRVYALVLSMSVSLLTEMMFFGTVSSSVIFVVMSLSLVKVADGSRQSYR